MTDVVGVYPGTFDPFTYGHLDIVKRALKVVDTLVIGVAQNSGKHTVFSNSERIDMIKNELAGQTFAKGKKVIVKPIPNLLIDFARDAGASVIFRGLRAVSDFDREFKLCVMNRRLNEEIESVFIMTDERFQFVSSTFTKEIARLGGDISTFVSPAIALKLKEKFRE